MEWIIISTNNFKSLKVKQIWTSEKCESEALNDKVNRNEQGIYDNNKENNMHLYL